MHSLFISDLHLDATRPDKVDLFQQLLTSIDNNVASLYILGDLFEFWSGDDDVSACHLKIIQSIKDTTDRNIPVYVMRGNRDFLLGKKFEEQTGATLLNDPSIVDLFGQKTLIMHGDLLCTDDRAYQRFRQFTNNRVLQTLFLLLPLKIRQGIAQRGRKLSQSQNQIKSLEIMDVNQQTVERYMNEHSVKELIHGHTHRQALHQFTLNDLPARRFVLGDWYEEDSVLVYKPMQQDFFRIRDYIRAH